MGHPFDRQGMIGVEEEFYAFDPDTLEPAPAADDLLDEPPEGLQDKLDVELFKCVIEVRTETASSLDEALDHVKRKREALQDYAADNGYTMLGAGLHPTATWRELEHTDKPRYRDQLDRIQYPQHRNLTAGMHVHVGIDDPDRAVWIADQARQYLPLLLALSANSPFWQGNRTGLRSTRAVVFENLPTTGIPPSFGTWDDFKQFESTMLDTGSIADRGGIWWDARPHTGYGTVEVRVMDAQTSLERSQGFVILVTELIRWLDDLYPDGNTQSHPIIEQNKWRAVRYGHDASFIRDSEATSIHSWFDALIDDLGIDDQRVTALIEGSGAQRQLRDHEEGGRDQLLDGLRI
ncbi:MAG: glutamate--cysteine ligase [Candidatus Nanohaloarchaea archaeon]|nr:glutamate--cysteine ligase [Candidatus Nanohaloarchaea archaeon]